MNRMNLEEKYRLLNKYEDELYSKGFTNIAGMDEAGRGPLCGPVAVACCILNPLEPILGLDDSKKLSAIKRDKLYEEIKSKALGYKVVLISNNIIDDINILEATKRGMHMCVEALSLNTSIDHILLDYVPNISFDIPFMAIKKGDANSNSIAAASILAKVTRDREMEKYDELYPQYGFAKNKGYGTKAHYEAIEEYGITPIHRRSFLKKIL